MGTKGRNVKTNQLTAGLYCSFVFAILILSSFGCGDSKSERVGKSTVEPGPVSKPKRESNSKASIEEADVSVLFIGNSHTGPIPRMLTAIFEHSAPEKKVLFARATYSGFLVDHAERPETLELLQRGQWDYVVLQAQKYSTTGKYHYPYDGSYKLSEIARNQGTQVIMYPEWSSRDKPEEFKRIDKIHHEIAAKTGAVVAPIGQTWSDVQEASPDLELYAMDGNHASFAGSYLNAAIFYSMLTEQQVDSEAGSNRQAGSIKNPLDGPTIALLNQAAWKSVAAMKKIPK